MGHSKRREGETVGLLTLKHISTFIPDFISNGLLLLLFVQVLILQGQKHEVTYLCPSPDGIHIAVGYEDGAVRIFSLLNGESDVSFNGHKSAVSVIHYDGLGARLVTGSRVHSLDHCAILFTQFLILLSELH